MTIPPNACLKHTAPTFPDRILSVGQAQNIDVIKIEEFARTCDVRSTQERSRLRQQLDQVRSHSLSARPSVFPRGNQRRGESFASDGQHPRRCQDKCAERCKMAGLALLLPPKHQQLENLLAPTASRFNNDEVAAISFQQLPASFLPRLVLTNTAWEKPTLANPVLAIVVLARPILAKTNFGQHFWCHGGAPKGGAQKGGRALKGGGPKISRFFSLPPQFFILFALSFGLFR